jgi:protein phosphatase 1 regulatory subunit 10
MEGESMPFLPVKLGADDKPFNKVDVKGKKRKLSEPIQSKSNPASKKAALGGVSSTKPLPTASTSKKKESAAGKPAISASSSASSSYSNSASAAWEPVTPVAGKAAAVKDAKSDSSFFSAPKPKPKLPSFKKAPPQPAAAAQPGVSAKSGSSGDPGNIAQPSSIDPFQEALKSMKAAAMRKDSPSSTATPPPVTGGASSSAATPPLSAGLNKAGKKKKSVTWAAAGQLESVKLIERAVYDDDPADVCFSSLTFFERRY